MKKNILFLTLLVAVFCFSSCDKVEDATSVTVDVPDFTVNFNAPITDVAPFAKANPVYYFSGEDTIRMTDSYFEKARSYKNRISKIDADKITVKITRLDGNTQGTITNLKFTAHGITPEVFEIPSYTLGQVYDNAEFKTFVLKAMNYILNNTDGLILKVGGITDVTSGVFKCELLVSGMTVKAKTVKF